MANNISKLSLDDEAINVWSLVNKGEIIHRLLYKRNNVIINDTTYNLFKDTIREDIKKTKDDNGLCEYAFMELNDVVNNLTTEKRIKEENYIRFIHCIILLMCLKKLKSDDDNGHIKTWMDNGICRIHVEY